MFVFVLHFIYVNGDWILLLFIIIDLQMFVLTFYLICVSSFICNCICIYKCICICICIKMYLCLQQRLDAGTADHNGLIYWCWNHGQRSYLTPHIFLSAEKIHSGVPRQRYNLIHKNTFGRKIAWNRTPFENPYLDGILPFLVENLKRKSKVRLRAICRRARNWVEVRLTRGQSGLLWNPNSLSSRKWKWNEWKSGRKQKWPAAIWKSKLSVKFYSDFKRAKFLPFTSMWEHVMKWGWDRGPKENSNTHNWR